MANNKGQEPRTAFSKATLIAGNAFLVTTAVLAIHNHEWQPVAIGLIVWLGMAFSASIINGPTLHTNKSEDDILDLVPRNQHYEYETRETPPPDAGMTNNNEPAQDVWGRDAKE